jgi:hypothetical protein
MLKKRKPLDMIQALKETELKRSQEIAKALLEILSPEEVGKRINLELEKVKK